MFLVWFACSPDLPTPTVEVSTRVPTVVAVRWDPPDRGEWRVEATAPGLPTRTAAAVDGRAVLLGLAADTRYRLRAWTDTGESPPTDVQTGEFPALPVWTVTVLDPERSEVAKGFVASGYVDAATGSDVWVIDGEGNPVWWWQPGPGWDLTGVTIGAEGESFVWGQYDATSTTDRAQVVEVGVDGRVVTVLDTPAAHHVAVETDPGRYAWIELEVRETERDGAPVVAGTDRIVEADADGSDAVEHYNAFDDLYAAGFHYPCFHSARSFDRYGVDDLTQWTHGNSLVYLPDADVFYVFERWADTLVKVDRATSRVLWQLGGPASDFTFPNGDPVFTTAAEPRLWSHGHLTDVWADGLLMYDNGNHATPQESRIARYTIDEATFSVKEVWSVPAPGRAFTEVLGDARLLPSGNVLATWSMLGTIEEITPEGDVVWRLQAEAGPIVTRSRWFGSWARL